MEKNYTEEIEQLISAGRGISDEEFDKLLDNYFSDRTDAEKERLGEAVIKVKLSRMEEIKQIDREIKFLDQLDGIEKYLNMAQLARSCFGKTRTWLYQRLHGWSVHGRPSRFTDSERKQFADALLLLSDNLKNVARKLS
jgi:hypothetical protein